MFYSLAGAQTVPVLTRADDAIFVKALSAFIPYPLTHRGGRASARGIKAGTTLTSSPFTDADP